MGGEGEAMQESMEEDANRYKHSKRNLPLLNTIFFIILVAMFLLPLTFKQIMVGLFILLVVYGFSRLYTMQ